MSNPSSYSLIDDDHIDDQETINVGNLIIDLESDLEKEKIENEQQTYAKPTTSSVNTTVNLSNTSNNTPTSTFGLKATSSSSSSSSANSSSNNINSSTNNSKSKSRHPTQNTSAATTAAPAHANNNIVNSNSSASVSITGATPNTTNNNNNSTPSASATTTTNSCSINPGHLLAKKTVFKSSADVGGQLKMRIFRDTKPGKSEHKIVTSPNQKSPTSSSSSSNCTTVPTTNQANSNNSEDMSFPLTKLTQSSSSISSTKECGTSTSIGTITEPDCLGPCEPGTSVTLEGIVWQETEGGILVVNITWRGKTYVGSLLDCTKHDWAPPRLCDSPASDIDSKAHKSVRTKRIVTRSNGIGLDEKNLLQTTGKLRNGKGRRILNDPGSCNKRQRESEKSDNSANQPETMASSANVSSITNSENTSVPMNVDTVSASTNESILTINNSEDITRPSSPVLIGCNELNCSKKFRNLNGLQYHKAHAHGTTNNINNAHDSNCSSSAKPPIKEDNEEESKEVNTMETESLDSNSEDNKHHNHNEVLTVERNRTPSPHLGVKISGKISPETCYPKANTNNISASSANIGHSIHTNNINMNFANPDIRGPPPPPVMRDHELDRRNLTNYLNPDREMRSPLGGPKLAPEYIPVPSNSSSSKSMSNLKQSSATTTSAPPPPPSLPLPTTSEEGIKPSGTSTGPPPAPHQANCYFNPSAFLANSFSPYLGPYFPRSPIPMYDPLAPPTSSANAAFLSRFMSTMRVPPPPDSPSKHMNPSGPKNPLPFPPFKMDPGSLPLPNPSMTNPPLLGMHPLPNSPMMPGSPHLRMPVHNEPILPPTSQPPFHLPIGMNPVLGLPGPPNSLGPLGGPQVPSLVDDPLAKQFPRRFN